MINNLPDFFEKMLEKQYGEDVTTKIIEGFSKDRLTTFRVNTIKSNIEEIEQALKSEDIIFEKSFISNEAYIVKNSNVIKLQELDIYKEGKIYVQSLSSMLPPIILNPKENNDVLDMCAAPGGKTTQMAAISNNKAHITACEMNKIRAERLKYNLDIQGASSVFCMHRDARTIDNYFSFDQILLDAPCSGSGTLNLKDINISKYFTKQLIDKSVKTQTALLNKAINILKTGCEMVYSTCSILQEENEDVLNTILSTGKVEIVPIREEFIKDLPLLPNKLEGTITVMPNELFEGFFVAKLRKTKN